MAKTAYNYEQAKLQELLRKLRLEKKLRQEDLAKKLGVPQSFVSKYESGERHLDFAEVRKVCQALDTPFVKFVQTFEESLI